MDFYGLNEAGTLSLRIHVQIFGFGLHPLPFTYPNGFHARFKFRRAAEFHMLGIDAFARGDKAGHGVFHGAFGFQIGGDTHTLQLALRQLILNDFSLIEQQRGVAVLAERNLDHARAQIFIG